MIHYDLRCGAGHEFDGWFKDSAAFATQAKAGFVECPACGSTEVVKQLMAPAIPKKGRGKPAALPAPAPAPAAAEAPSQVAAAGPVPAQLVALLQKVRAEVEKVATTSARNSPRRRAGSTAARATGSASTARPAPPTPRRCATRASRSPASPGCPGRTKPL
ncbi:DUF1178 family protein [Paeniroseomonas aquatica]